MKRNEFIKALLLFCSETNATAIANSYTDEEINKYGAELIEEIKEDYRFNAKINHYQKHGY